MFCDSWMDVGSCNVSSLPEFHTKTRKTIFPPGKLNHWNQIRSFVSLTLAWCFKVFGVQIMLCVGTPGQLAKGSWALRCFMSTMYLYFEVIRLSGHTYVSHQRHTTALQTSQSLDFLKGNVNPNSPSFPVFPVVTHSIKDQLSIMSAVHPFPKGRISVHSFIWAKYIQCHQGCNPSVCCCAPGQKVQVLCMVELLQIPWPELGLKSLLLGETYSHENLSAGAPCIPLTSK